MQRYNVVPNLLHIRYERLPGAREARTFPECNAHFGRHKRRIAAQLPHGTLSVFPIPCIWLSEQRTDQKRRREGLSRHFFFFSPSASSFESDRAKVAALLNSAEKKSYAFVIHYTWEESRFNLGLEESGAIINKPDPHTLFFDQRKK